MIEPLARIFCEKSQDEVSILLQHRVSPPVAAVSFGIRQMLRSVQFEYHAGIRTKKIHLHPPGDIKRDWQLNV